MKAKNLKDLVTFSKKGPTHSALFESERLWSELVCLDVSQQIGPISDHDSDAICLVVTGDVIVQLDRARKRLTQWGSVLVPAETDLVVTNASGEPAVLMLVAAPPPVPRQLDE